MEITTDSKKKLGAFLWILFLFFASFIVYNEYILIKGEKVFLKTIPVDPRDLLRGDYVILRYEIENDPKVQEFLNHNTIQTWAVVYFSLQKDPNNKGSLDTISLKKPSNNQLFIRWVYQPNPFSPFSFDLWIGKFFVPEGRWREIERIINQLEVLVSIDRNGNAKVVDLYYQWKKIDFTKETLFE